MSTWQNRTQQQSTVSRRSDLDGEVVEIIGDRAATLSWDQSLGGLQVINGGSNYSILSDFKGSIVKLWNEFFEGKATLDLSSDKAELIKKRLFHLEHEIDGLLRRKINFSVKDAHGGERSLDYSGLLNEKETQIVELEKKIQNLEERLRRASQREAELESEIVRLKTTITKLEKPGVTKADIEAIWKVSGDFKSLQTKYSSLRDRFSGFASLIRTQSERLRGQGITLEIQNDLNNLVRSQGLTVSVNGSVVSLVDFKDRVVEVPVSDARTKHLIHMLAVQMKKFFAKYPKLRDQCDVRLAEFFQQEIIDLIEVDELDRVVEIVKYVPDVYRVENVYAYSSEKSRKVQFHLRVLIKALLEELQKIKRRTGAVLEIDEGIIGMINAEIMDVVNVDDILKVFRVVPKIVEVEKIVQKIVDRVIEIPQVVPVEKIVQKIIERQQIVEVEKVVHVPVEIVKYVDVHHDKIVIVEKETEKVVEVPRVVEKVVQRIVQIPKLVTKEVIVEKIIEVERPTVVQKIIHVPVVEIREVEVVREKVVTVEKIVEKAVPVEVFVEKIVQKVVHVPQLVTVDRRNDVLVKQIQVQNAREVVNHIQRVPEIVEIVHERPVPLIQTVQRIVEVPKIIQKIVQIKVEVPTVKQVKVIEQMIVYRDRIKQVERIVNIPVEVVREVEKIVDRKVDVPFIVERVVRVPEIVTQIVVQRIENPVIVEVEKYVQKIVEVPKIIEVEIVKLVEVVVDNPVKILVQKIVEVPKTIERIKQVRVNIDKIIQKMVEVPKVVEVQKIVQKIVVVPRVIEKIVQVPQIVERIVDRIIENTQVIQVEKVVQVPVFQERVKTVQIPVNNYITENNVVQKIVEKIVPVEKVVSNIEVVKQTNERIVEHRVEVPRQVFVDRVVPVAHEVSKIVEIERQIIVPVEVPVPVDRAIEKVVVVERDVEKIVQCPQTIEKIVEVKVESIQIETLTEKVSVPVYREEIREVERIVPYVQTEIKEVKLFEQKIILNNVEVEKVIPVDRFIQKLATVTHEIVKAKQVEKLVDKPIEVQKLVTVQNFMPVLVEVNKLVEVFRDRPFEIPLIHQEIQQVKVIEEKVVAIEHTNTTVKQVQVHNDRIIEQQKLIVKTDVRNQIETQIQVVDRYEDKIVPITTSLQKIIEVPYILEKIVEKIVIMPQVVEVLKYVHEIVEEQTLGVAIGVDVHVQQTKYKGLYGKLKVQFQALLVELRRMRGSNPALKIQIELIEGFLIELDKLIAFPRIVQVQKQVQVEVQRKVPVLVPTLDLEAERLQVTLAMIVSKLVGELMRVQSSNPSLKLNIDGQILKIFSDQYRDKSGLLQGVDGKFNDSIHKIYGFYESFLNNLGGSSLSFEQQLIYTAALEQRLLVASLIDEANLQIKKAQTISEKRGEAFRVVRQSLSELKGKFGDLQGRLGSSTDNQLRALLDQFRVSLNSNFQTLGTIEPIVSLVQRQVHNGGLIGNGAVVTGSVSFSTSQGLIPNWDSVNINDPKFFTLFESRFRALTKQNELLRDKYLRWQKERPNVHGLEDRDRIIDNLQKRIVELQSEINTFRSQSSVSVNVTGNTQEYQLKIRTLNSKNQQLESQLRSVKMTYETQIKQKDRQIADLLQKLKIGDSRITGVNDSTPSSKTSLGQDRMNSSGFSGTSDSPYGGYSSSSSSTYSQGGNTVQQTTLTQGATYSNVTPSYGSGSNRLTGSGASYGQTATSQLSGSGAYNQQQGQTQGASYSSSTSSTSGVASSSSGYSRNYSNVQGATSNVQGANVTYGATSNLSGSGVGSSSYGSSSLTGSRTQGSTLQGSGVQGSSTSSSSTTQQYSRYGQSGQSGQR